MSNGRKLTCPYCNSKNSKRKTNVIVKNGYQYFKSSNQNKPMYFCNKCGHKFTDSKKRERIRRANNCLKHFISKCKECNCYSSRQIADFCTNVLNKKISHTFVNKISNHPYPCNYQAPDFCFCKIDTSYLSSYLYRVCSNKNYLRCLYCGHKLIRIKKNGQLLFKCSNCYKNSAFETRIVSVGTDFFSKDRQIGNIYSVKDRRCLLSYFKRNMIRDYRVHPGICIDPYVWKRRVSLFFKNRFPN